MTVREQDGIGHQRFRGGEQARRLRHQPGQPGVGRGLSQPASAFLRRRRQLARALPRPGGGRKGIPGPRPPRRLLELSRHLLVVPECRRRPVPRVAVDLSRCVEHLGQSGVGGAPGRKRRGSVDRRPDERVPETHLERVDADQVRLLGRVERRDVQLQAFRGAEHDLRFCRVVRGGDHEQLLRARRKRAHALGEQALDTRRQRQRQRQRLARRELRGCQQRGELGHRQRVAPGRSRHAACDILRHRCARTVGQQLPHRHGVQRPQAQLGQRARLELTLTRSEQHRHSLGVQPPRGEHQRLLRVVVNPLRVVDDAKQRPLLGHLREQREHRERNTVQIRRGVLAQPERALQRRRLRSRDPLERAQRGPEELVERGVRQPRLRLDPPGLERGHVARFCSRLVQKRRLARPRLADDEQGAATPIPGCLQQRAHALLFA